MVNEWKKRWNSHKGHETVIWYLLGYLLGKIIEENWAKIQQNWAYLIIPWNRGKYYSQKSKSFPQIFSGTKILPCKFMCNFQRHALSFYTWIHIHDIGLYTDCNGEEIWIIQFFGNDFCLSGKTYHWKNLGEILS